MGYDASASVAIGVRKSVSDFKKNVKVRGCIHKETKAKFCPECGQPMWIDKTEYIIDINMMYEENDDGISCIRPNSDTDDIVIGFFLCGVSSYENISGVDILTESEINEYKEKLKKFLGDLWDELEFGIYGIFQESY